VENLPTAARDRLLHRPRELHVSIVLRQVKVPLRLHDFALVSIGGATRIETRIESVLPGFSLALRK